MWIRSGTRQHGSTAGYRSMLVLVLVLLCFRGAWSAPPLRSRATPAAPLSAAAAAVTAKEARGAGGAGAGLVSAPAAEGGEGGGGGGIRGARVAGGGEQGSEEGGVSAGGLERGSLAGSGEALAPGVQAPAGASERTRGELASIMDQMSLRARSGPGIELPDRCLVCIIPQGTQLANGLRHIVTCAMIAQLTQRRLLLDPFQSLSASFFAKYFLSGEWTLVRSQEYEGQCTAVPEDDAYRFLLRDHPKTNFHPLVEGTVCLDRLGCHPRMSLSSIYAVKPVGMRDDEFVRRKMFILNTLPWPQGLKQSAREWAATLRQHTQGGGLIGVHVRYTDNWRDRNKVTHGLNTPIQSFCDALSRISREGQAVLLCTDSEVARKYMSSQGFKCQSPPIVSRQRYTQALFEMFLLSQTDCIIGSSGSTFSFEAALLDGGTDLMLYSSGLWQTWHLRSMVAQGPSA